MLAETGPCLAFSPLVPIESTEWEVERELGGRVGLQWVGGASWVGVRRGFWGVVLELWGKGNLATTGLCSHKAGSLVNRTPSLPFVLLLPPVGAQGLLSLML